MTGKEVAALKDEELKLELGKLRNELFDLRSKAVTAKVEDTSRLGKVRRDVARLLGEQNKRRNVTVAGSVAQKVAAKPAAAQAAKPAAKAPAKKAAAPKEAKAPKADAAKAPKAAKTTKAAAKK